MRRSSRRVTCAIALLMTAAVVSVAIAAPTSTKPPKVVGTLAFDRTVTCDPGTFTPKPAKIAYTWTANGGPIAKATKSKLTIDQPYFMGGYNIGCTVTATDATGATASASSTAVMPALGETTLKILSITSRPRGGFVVKGQLGPKHLLAKYVKGGSVTIDRKVPGQPKAEYQLSKIATVDHKGRFTVTGHDKAGKRAEIISFYPGHDGTGIWAPIKVVRTVTVSAGFTGSSFSSAG